MKKMLWPILFFAVLFAGTLAFSLLALGSAAPSDYFSVERKLLQYGSSVENTAFKSYLEVTTGTLGAKTKDWEKSFAEKPKAEWLYILPLGTGMKYQPLVDTGRQGYDFVLDTLYYVNADGYIAAMDVATRTETPLFKPEGRVKAMQATVDLLFYECAGKLYRYHIPSGQKDFFVTIPGYGGGNWTVVSNQTVSLISHWTTYWYNREEDQYYTAHSGPSFFYVSLGEENQVPPAASVYGTVAKEVPYELAYDYLIRRIPRASYAIGKVDYSNFKPGGLLRNQDGLLRQELDYFGWIDLEDEISYSDFENKDSMVYLPASTVRQVYEGIFGTGAFDSLAGKDITSVVGGSFYYKAETDEYAFRCYTGGGGDSGDVSRIAYTDVVEKDGVTQLYARVATARPMWNKTAVYPGFTTALASGSPAFAIGNGDKIAMNLRHGEYDEYLPLYRVTLRENADGTYCWVSTELVEEGKESLNEILPKAHLVSGKDDHETYVATHRQLVTSPLGSANGSWTETVILTPENVEEWKAKIYPDADLIPDLGFWVYGKTQYSNKFFWQHCVGGSVYGAFGYLRYYVNDGILYESNMDSGLGRTLSLVGDGVEEIKAFRDLVFFRKGNKIYRCYLPDNTLKEIATLPEGAAWEPVSNRVIRFETAARTYWYDTEAKTESTSYDGPEILTVEPSQIAGLDAGKTPSVLPNTDTGTSDTESNTPSDTSATDASVDSLTNSSTDSVPDSDVNSAEEDKASLWPWMVGGAVLLVGIGGAVTWFLIRKKK